MWKRCEDQFRNLEFKKEVCGIFVTTGQKTGQKLAYPTEYLSNYTGPIFTELSALVVMCMRIIKLALVLWSVKGRYYGNQSILGFFFAYVEIWLLSLFALSFWNGMHYRCANACINSSTKAPALYRNVVKFSSVTLHLRREFVEFLQRLGRTLMYVTHFAR